MPDNYIIEPLNPAMHCRERFDCGVPALNDFLRLRARKEMAEKLSACFVIVPESDPRTVAGYYTLSSATILRSVLPESVTKKLPRYQELPATLLGRLARDVRFKGAQIGDRLMVSALFRAVQASKVVAAWAVVTDPKDERARRFYEAFGFKPLMENRQFVTMKAAEAWITVR